VFEIADLQARNLWRYLRESLSFEMASGVIAIKGDTIWRARVARSPSAQRAQHPGDQARSQAQRRCENCIDLGRIEIADTRLDLRRHRRHCEGAALRR